MINMIQFFELTAHFHTQDFIKYGIIVFLIAYAIGNINPAIIFGWMNNIDIRKEGSGNAGMTNTIRVLGLGWGIAVFVVDVLKAFIAVKIAFNVSGGNHDAQFILCMCAFAGVVLGHCFPALYGFKGGKGVAASLGAALALNWQSALAAASVAAVVFLISGRRMSIASIGAVITYPIFVFLFVEDKRFVFFAIAAVLFLIVQHAANIRRIARGEEKALTIGHGVKHDNAGEKAGDKNDDTDAKEGTEDKEQ